MVQRFTGGLRLSNPVRFSGGANATWPFATLTVDDEGVSLAPRGSIRRLLAGKWMDDGEPITIAYDELVRVELIRLRRGVRFHTQSPDERVRSWDRRNGAIFWTWQLGRVRQALESHGVRFT